MIIHPSMYFCNENLFSLPFSRKHQISKFKLKYTFDRDFEFLQVMQNALLDQTQLQSKKKSRSFCPSYSPLSVKSAESLIAESCNRHLTSITFCCSRYFLFPLDCLSKSINIEICRRHTIMKKTNQILKTSFSLLRVYFLFEQNQCSTNGQIEFVEYLCSGCGTVGRAVVLDNGSPRSSASSSTTNVIILTVLKRRI